MCVCVGMYGVWRPAKLIARGLGASSPSSASLSGARLGIPIAHCHGGETTEGVIDESIRHSITKMAHIHFCSTDIYRKRIIQLGENPNNVFNVGALGVENINRLELLNKKDFEKTIGRSLGGKSAIITFHPVTLDKKPSKKHFSNLLEALDLYYMPPCSNAILIS